MINEWRYHFLGGPLSGRTYLNREREIHDKHGIVDFPPTPEAWAKYRDAAAALQPHEQPPEMPPRVEYRIAYTEAHLVGQEMMAEFYMVPATLPPDQDIGFVCRLAKSAIDKLNDMKASQ
ncbi:hypothetical protein [Kosakonia phage Kc237]|nr:hypothetical protein [Kosakonia phage Kc237]